MQGTACRPSSEERTSLMRTPQTGLGSVLTIIVLTTAALALPASADENHAVRHGGRASDRPDSNGQIVFR